MFNGGSWREYSLSIALDLTYRPPNQGSLFNIIFKLTLSSSIKSYFIFNFILQELCIHFLIHIIIFNNNYNHIFDDSGHFHLASKLLLAETTMMAKWYSN